MKAIYRTALAAFFVVFFPHFASAEECSIKNGFNICIKPKPLTCDSESNYTSPIDFAEKHGGIVTLYQQFAPGLFHLRVSEYDKNEELKRNSIFLHNHAEGTICFVATGEPLGMAL